MGCSLYLKEVICYLLFIFVSVSCGGKDWKDPRAWLCALQKGHTHTSLLNSYDSLNIFSLIQHHGKERLTV